MFFLRWSKAMRMLLEGDFGPITWKRRSYLYEQGLLIRKALVSLNPSMNDVDSGDEKGLKEKS